jgi:hypothetical protein
MSHLIYKVRPVKTVAPFTLTVEFDDGTEQTIDFRPVLAGELYSPLRELSIFNQKALAKARSECARPGRSSV